MNFELKTLFIGLTQDPGLEKIDVIMKNEAFNVLISQIMDETVGTEAKKTICFTKNASSLLPCFSSIENNFKQTLQAEREMVNIVLPFITQITPVIYENYKVSIVMP